MVYVEGFVKLWMYEHNVFDAAFKFDIDNVDAADNEFTWLNVVFDAAFKYDRDNVDADKQFNFVFVASELKSIWVSFWKKWIVGINRNINI